MNARKRKVIQVALQLFLERGYVQTSIQDIIEHAEISKGTFYNYFSSKDDCLIAIIEIGREQTMVKRNELLLGKQRSDVTVLIDQIVVGIQLNYNQSLLPLLENVFQSGNADLKSAMRNYHLREIKWLATRLTDVYGQAVKPFKYDVTMMLFGSLQSFQKMWRAVTQEPFNVEAALKFLFAQLNQMIPHLQQGFMTKEISTYMGQYIAAEHISKENILQELKELQPIARKISTESYELTIFLLDELSKEKPNLTIIRAILPSFSGSFATTAYTEEAINITSSLWRYLEEKFH